ncbi:MAG: M48 family metalloprotease [Acidobacteriota bacterium]
MKRTLSRRVTASITLAIFAASCATTKLPPISAGSTTFTPEKDEQKLWVQAREEEAKLRDHITIYDDPLLEDYLDDVVRRLDIHHVEASSPISYRVTVVEDPTLNAFAYPHGSLYVHTGLLARMENEDQLATVLGHEMTHVENRHMVRHQRSMRNKQIGFSIAAVAGAVIAAGEQGDAVREGHYGKAARIGVLSDILLGLGLTLAFMAAVNGYGRNLEREADEGGFEKMETAGYDIREAPKVYAALEDDHGDAGKYETFFFGNHPRLSERIESARSYATEHPEAVQASHFEDQRYFRRRMRPIIRTDARLNIELGRYNLAEDQLERVLEEVPADAQALDLMGLVKMKKADEAKDESKKQALRDAARHFFETALQQDPDIPEAHRELGLLNYRSSRFASACDEFRAYIKLAADDEDVQTYRDYVLELDQDGYCH